MYYGQQFWPGFLDIRHPRVQSKADLLRVVADYAARVQSGQWISRSQGFHLQSGETLDRWDLDGVAPNNPVYLRHGSGQYAVVNSLALQIAGIDASTPNPPSSVIVHDSRGEPTGVLSHYPAEWLVAKHATGYGDRTEEQKLEDIEIGQDLCLQAGYTSVQDVIVTSWDDIEVYRRFAESGRLKVRLYLMLYLSTEEQAINAARDFRPIDSVGPTAAGSWPDGGQQGPSSCTTRPCRVNLSCPCLPGDAQPHRPNAARHGLQVAVPQGRRGHRHDADGLRKR
jgi:predicted amidohydrolase YtcJ